MCAGPSSGSTPHTPWRPPAHSTPRALCLWTRRSQRAWKTSTKGGDTPAHTHPALSAVGGAEVAERAIACMRELPT